MTLQTYLDRSRRFDVAVWAVVPLFVIYELGLLCLDAGPMRNGADLVLRESLRVQDRWSLLALNGGVLVLLLLVAGKGGQEVRSFRVFMLLLVESLFWALLLAPMSLILGDLARLAAGPEWTDRLTNFIYAAGAGLYEELIFRLGLVGVLSVAISRLLHADPILARVAAVLFSALAFSGFHHVGAHADPFTAQVFTFRFLAGVLLGMLFHFRGFAVCVWAHALYDMLLAFDLGL